MLSDIHARLPDADDIRDWLVANIADALGIEEDEVAGDQPFSEFGLDSTDALRLSADLGIWLDVEVAPTIAWYHPTIDALADHLAGEVCG